MDSTAVTTCNYWNLQSIDLILESDLSFKHFLNIKKKINIYIFYDLIDRL